jgi:hypothetical protein
VLGSLEYPWVLRLRRPGNAITHFINAARISDRKRVTYYLAAAFRAGLTKLSEDYTSGLATGDT